MRNKRKEMDELPDDIFASERNFAKHFRRIEGKELAEHKAKLARSLDRPRKSRVTIYLDADIVSTFKEKAEDTHTGYQTLINNALRMVIEGTPNRSDNQHLKDDLLKDKRFLLKLRSALAA